MKRICLVYTNEMELPSYFNYATNISTDFEETLPPMGLLYIIGNSKYGIDIIDNRINRYNYEELSKILIEYDIIGFGGTIFEIKEARKLSKCLMNNGKITIYGGPNATVNWNLYIDEFNIIVRGEADLIFDEIVNNVDDKNALERLGFIKINNTFVNLGPFRVDNLDNLKFPNRTKINLNKYRRREVSYLGDVYPIDVIVSSRGCPFNCYFCSSKVIWGQRYSYRSVENLMEEVYFMIKKYGTKGIYFREDNFTINRKRLIQFCNEVKKLGLIWMCESRVDTLNKEIIKIMAKSGCKGIWFGLESTDDVVLKRIKKNITFKQMRDVISLCNKYKITTGGGFMLGFPFDDKKSIKRNYYFSKKLGLKVRFYNRVWAIPYSKMYEEIVHDGLDYYTFENIILPGTKYMTADQLNKIYYKLVSKKEIVSKKISKLLGKKRTALIKRYLPYLYKLGKKCLEN